MSWSDKDIAAEYRAWVTLVVLALVVICGGLVVAIVRVVGSLL